MRAEHDEREATMRKAIVAVADAAHIVARTRSAIEHASRLVREAAPRVTAEGSTSQTGSVIARALGELEVAGREAVRVAADITSAGFSLATAAGQTSELIGLLPPENRRSPRVVARGNLIRRTVQAAITSAVLAEEARCAVDRAATLVREAARHVEPEEWPRRMQADAALAGAWAAARGAGALAEQTASARRSVASATPGAPILRLEEGGAR